MNPLLAKIVEARKGTAIDKITRNYAGTATRGLDPSNDVSTYAAIKFEEAVEDLERLDRLERLADRLPPPPGPYSAGGSFYRDLVAAGIDGDPLAMRRLGEQTQRAEALSGVELRRHPFGGHVPPGLEFSEVRASSSSSFGATVPDAWVVGAAGGLPRHERPLLDAVLANGGRMDMPAEGVELTVVATTTQSLTASSTSAENQAVTQTDVVGTNSQVNVQAVVASIIVSRQAFERGSIDAFINSELSRAVDAEQERLFVQGLLGAGLSFVAANTAEQVSVGRSVLQAARAGSDIRGTPTRIIAWHPRRLLWMASLRSSSSQMDDVFCNLANEGHIVNVQSGALLASTIGSQDKVITMNGADVRYGEEPTIRAYIDPSSQAGTGGVRIYGYKYFAQSFLYPSQIGCASGSGLAAPASLV